MPITIEKPGRLIDIARVAGVSRTTVAKVLLDSGGKHVRISELTRERIQQIAQDIQYRPNVAARRLKGKSTQLIGVIIDSMAPEVSFSRLVRMEAHAAARGYRFMIGQSHEAFEHVRAYAKDFASYGVDGVICISHDYPEIGARIAEEFSKFRNVVFVDKPVVNAEKLCYVEIDYAHGMSLLVDHLLAKSRQNIGLLFCDLKYTPVKAQWDGFIAACERNKVHLREDLMLSIPGTLPLVSQEILESHVSQLCDRSVDAIVAMDDAWAVKVMKALKKLGKRVPEDVAVVGFGNAECATIYEPGITTVDENPPELSTIVVERLLSMIEGTAIPSEERHTLLQPRLVIRESA